MEIEVGEYVRTKEGYIAKLIEKDEDFKFYEFDNTVRKSYRDKLCYMNKDELEEYIVKHSKQLIDLIEVGDIVEDEYNKSEVAFVKYDRIYCNDYNLDDSLITLREQDIKAILTRESYIANCYKVEGEEDER